MLISCFRRWERGVGISITCNIGLIKRVFTKPEKTPNKFFWHRADSLSAVSIDHVVQGVSRVPEVTRQAKAY